MKFFTFCVDIGRHSRVDLNRALKQMLESLNKYLDSLFVVVYTNYDINIIRDYVQYRKYYDNTKTEDKLYDSKWLNLSYNKINIYKDLYDEFKDNFIWIDLDTIITYDISYIKNLDNLFVENGGNCINGFPLFSNTDKYKLPMNRYIQGNFWKINIDMYNELMICMDIIKGEKLMLQYDLQDLFGYYIYFYRKGDLNNIYILGYTFMSHTISGLSMWHPNGNTHAKLYGLDRMYYDYDNSSSNNKHKLLKTKIYPDKDIHLVSFTFMTLKNLWNSKKFQLLFDIKNNKIEQNNKI